MKISPLRNTLVEPRCPDYGGSTVFVRVVVVYMYITEENEKSCRLRMATFSDGVKR